MSASEQYFRYWGKAHSAQESGLRYHLLAYHSLDVAAVGLQILEANPQQLARLASLMGVSSDTTKWILVWALANHDLGKFARAFQNLAPGLSESLVPGDHTKPYTLRHDSLGYLIWSEVLRYEFQEAGFLSCGIDHPNFDDGIESIDTLIKAVTGHHGQPPKETQDSPSRYFCRDDLAAVQGFVNIVSDLFLSERPEVIEEFFSSVTPERMQQASWLIAGWSVLADWLGSDQAEFPYQVQVVPLEEYWIEHARPRAGHAIQKAGLAHQCQPSVYQSIQETFSFILEPTPLQRYASELSIGDGPQLFVLEDVTGAGKTEAATILAHRLMSAGLAQGLYVALPTMATANAMYSRMAEVYRKLFMAQETPSLVLAHGNRQHSRQFQESVGLRDQPADANYGQGEPSATAFCNAWIADNRKKALLADVGIGTLDQALLAVLPVRHQTLRYFGLMNKVLLVDEVHAYDPYMNELLLQLLRLHASAGGSAILMTATLPQAVRQKFVSAFAGAAGFQPLVTRRKDYPLITAVSSEGVSEEAVGTRPSVQREVSIRRVADETEAIRLVLTARAEGKCVCWIRNTVGDAVSTFEELVESIPAENISLFHSRFAMADRLAIEQATLTRFGKESISEDRRGQVLIATQVVEQSLDLDFDVMITDLAPVDLIIQRVGRLHRHVRDAHGNPVSKARATEPRAEPVLHILSPDPSAAVHEDWIKSLLSGTQAVYQHVGQLWLSARQLFSQPSFRMPDDARRLIEGVYSEIAQADIPDALQRDSQKAEGKASSHVAFGKINGLRLERGYSIDSALGEWSSDIEVSTRLSEESVTVALATVNAGGISPYAAGMHAWSLSQLNVPLRQWQKIRARFTAADEALIEQAKADNLALKWVEVLPLTETLSMHYSAAYGLTGEPQNEETSEL